MTERGLPIADAALACPFVAFDDQRDDRSDRPDPRHRCYAESPPSPRARAHQEAYCLSANFPVCPTFQDWARREAARVQPSAGAGSPAERLRDVPAQRIAGERPPAFGAPGAAVDAAVPAGEPGTILPPAMPGTASDSMLERIIEREGAEDVGALDAGDAQDAPGTGGLPPRRPPWDLPARRPVQPEWSAPPPWAASRASSPAGDEADDVDVPEFLRSDSGRSAGDQGLWTHGGRAADEEDVDAAAAGGAAGFAGRDAAMARLRALGMGAGPAPGDVDDDFAQPRAAAAGGRNVAPDAAERGSPGSRSGGTLARAGIAGTSGVAGDAGAGMDGGRGAIDGVPTPDAPSRSSGGLARILGWDRRPRAGSSRSGRQPVKEPSWERPRRYEAYPTLKTRVGMPIPSRLWLAAGAVLVAAAILFFVPPLFLKQSGGTGGPGATPTPAASGSAGPVASASPSAGPTARPTPKQVTYTVRQGDTLSSIAKRFKITVEQLLAANKQIKDPNKIAIGDVLVIPSAAPTTIVDGGASP